MSEKRAQVDRNLVAKAMQTHEGQKQFRPRVAKNKKKEYKRKKKHHRKDWEGDYGF